MTFPLKQHGERPCNYSNQLTPDKTNAQSMIPKSVQRFSEKIMLK
jgi:hypothetical protein